MNELSSLNDLIVFSIPAEEILNVQFNMSWSQEIVIYVTGKRDQNVIVNTATVKNLVHMNTEKLSIVVYS